MEIRKLWLDKGTSTTIHGNLYGLDYLIEEDGYRTKVYLDLFNRRIRVVNYSGPDIAGLVRRLEYLARANQFDKVFLKARADEWEKFLPHGFMLEGIFKYYFQGEHAYCLSRFYSQERRLSFRYEEEDEIMAKAHELEVLKELPQIPEGYSLRAAVPGDIPEICELYSKVFKTYPIPLNQPPYLEMLMAMDYIFLVIEHEGRIVSCASADIDLNNKNAEITDCASLPECRGKGLMAAIIAALEEELKTREIGCLYSLARALSPGMNMVFKKLGYTYSGRLVNNCDIFGKMEDMNLWVKKL